MYPEIKKHFEYNTNNISNNEILPINIYLYGELEERAIFDIVDLSIEQKKL